MRVCSTTRVKSAIVFSLMVEGSGSLGFRIVGTLRLVEYWPLPMVPASA